MSAILTPVVSIVLAFLWFMAFRSQKTVFSWAVGVVHGGLLAWLSTRAEFSMLTGTGLLLVSCWAFGVLATFWIREPWAAILPVAQAVFCILSGVGVSFVVDVEPLDMNPWTIPHVAASVAWFVCMIAGTVVALTRLRGRRIGLLLAALVLAALPLLSPHSTLVRYHQDGKPLTVEAALHDSITDGEVIRTLSMRGELPYEAPLRQLALLAIVFGLAVAVVRWKARINAQGGALGIVIASAVAIHTVLLITSLFPRPIDGTQAGVVETVREQLLLEANTTEHIVRVTAAAPPYTGGPGGVALIVLSALTLVLVCLGYYGRRNNETFEERSSLLERLEARMVALAVVAWSLVILSGFFWSDMAWGAFVVSDPKLYAQFVIGGLYALYFLVQRVIPERSDGPSWLLLLICLVALISLLGPELGLIAPTLHHFGV